MRSSLISRAREVRRQPLWDRSIYGVPDEFDSFDVDHAFKIPVEPADSGQWVSGILPATRQFIIDGFSAFPDADIPVEDFRTLLLNTVFRLIIGDKEYLNIPFAMALSPVLGVAWWLQNLRGAPLVDKIIDELRKAEKPEDDDNWIGFDAGLLSRPAFPLVPHILIPQLMHFQVRSVGNKALSAPTRVTVVLHGVEERPVQ